MIKYLFLLGIFFASTLFAQQTVGLFTYEQNSYNGYTLFTPISSTKTFLIDNCGHKIHEWSSNYVPGHSVYFLPDGSLLRTGNINSSYFSTAGKAGIIEKYDWDNNLIWQFQISSSTMISHHDIKPMPNGNVLAIVWEKIPISDVINEGRNPSYLSSSFMSEKIIEIQPIGADSGIIVWQWRIFDHLIQSFDITKENYGVVSEHPELININFNSNNNPDWIHMNSIAYNEELDQIIMSAHNFNEVWIVDHSTTISEAAGHLGGNCGKGGDLLYRWGNSAAYGSGTLPNGGKKLFGQHDVQWIDSGLPDAGKILLYNNGINRPAGLFSTIEIIEPPLLSDGNYLLNSGEAYGPLSPSYTYPSTPDLTFYSANISGTQQMPNGNILICEGDNGEFFEIDSSGQIVWKYINPATGSTFINQESPATNNQVFKIRRYSPIFSGFNGKDLTPGPVLELNPYPDNCLTFSTEFPKNVNDLEVNVFPNPSKDNLFIEFNSGSAHSIKIVNSMGIRVISTWVNKTPYQLDISCLPSGVYLLIVDNKLVKKIVKVE